MRPASRARSFFFALAVMSVCVWFAYMHSASVLDEAALARLKGEAAACAGLVLARSGRPDDAGLREAYSAALKSIPDAKLVAVVAGASTLESPVEGVSVDEIARRVPAAGQVTIFETIGKAGRFVWAVGRVKGSEDLAGVAIPVEPAVRSFAAIRESLLIGTALGAFAVFGALSMAARRNARAIGFLTDAARRMAKGYLQTRPPRFVRDEFRELAASLEQLAEGLSTTLAELKMERDLVGGILSGMAEGVLLIDREGKLALINPALRDMLLLPTLAIGKPPLEVIRNTELEQLIERARSGETPAPTELELAGIRPRRVLVRASSLVGDPGGVLAVFVDVTEVRRLEGMRRDFVANVSHELRTPVTAIRSAAETVRGAAASDPIAAARFIDIIERNATRLHLLVEDLLDLSKIEAKQFHLEVDTIGIAPFLRQAVNLLRDKAENRRIRITVRADRGLAARADRRALEQIVVNLVDNAIKYCPEGAEVVVEAAVVDGEVRVDVADTGPGIEAKHLPRLFERFYRVDVGRSRHVGGTGLGLSIVKHLVEASGGRVSVVSTVGKGTTFSFTLPLANDTAPVTDRRDLALNAN